MSPRIRGACLVAVAVLTVGCGDDVAGPVPGAIVVSLATPNTDDAAMVLEITGPDTGTITATDPATYLHVVGSGSSRTVVLVGDLQAGELLRFTVPDVDAADRYAAAVRQVADTSNALRTSLSAYALTAAPDR